MTHKVTLMNFGDAPHVVMDHRNRPREVSIGGLVDVELTETQLKRIKKRHEVLMVLPADLLDKAQGPHMRMVLDALRNFDQITYDDALKVAGDVFGPNELGVRPKKSIIRVALAKRAREAAHYIQVGAADTADRLLGKDRPVTTKASENGPGVVPADIVQGDPDPEADETDNDETQSDSDETEQGENDSEDEGSADGAADGEDEADLSRAAKGPGVALAGRDPAPRGHTTPRVQRNANAKKATGTRKTGTRGKR
jgi:hypothetical protein